MYLLKTWDVPVSTEPVTLVPEPRTYFRPWLTQWLVAANVLVYVAMAAASRSPMDFTIEFSKHWGADFGPLTFGGEPWRVWTSNYVHGGLLHILFNMWCLWNLGALAERILGRWTYFLSYTACGIGGSLLSLWWNPLRVSVGASGAIFGIAGALITAIYFGKLPFPKEALRGISRSLITFAGYNLLFGFLPGIDNSAHMGGLLTGLILGALLAPALHRPEDERSGLERVVFLGVALALFGAWTAVKHASAYVVPLDRASQALRTGDAAKALPDLESAARQRPNDAMIQGLLGVIYIRLKDYPHAEAALKRVLDLKPNDLNARFNLGLVYGATARYEDARLQFADVTERDPKNDDGWMMLGSSLKDLHKPAEAEAAFQRAIQLNPKNNDALRELGWVQLGQNQTDAALQSFRRALEINDKDADAVLGLERAYVAKHMSKEAAETLQRYQALHPPPEEDPDENERGVP